MYETDCVVNQRSTRVLPQQSKDGLFDLLPSARSRIDEIQVRRTSHFEQMDIFLRRSFLLGSNILSAEPRGDYIVA